MPASSGAGARRRPDYSGGRRGNRDCAVGDAVLLSHGNLLLAQRAAAANEFNQRFRERAAGVLTAEQLAIYTKLQDDALEQHRSFEELRQASN